MCCDSHGEQQHEEAECLPRVPWLQGVGRTHSQAPILEPVSIVQNAPDPLCQPNHGSSASLGAVSHTILSLLLLGRRCSYVLPEALALMGDG